MTTQHTAAQLAPGGGYLAASVHPTRRLAVGYVRLRPDTDTAERDRLTAQLRGFAAQSGLHLVHLYIDRHAVRRSAFGELLQALCDPDMSAVIIPTPEHLSEFDGIASAMRALIEIETGADVLVMSHTTDTTEATP